MTPKKTDLRVFGEKLNPGIRVAIGIDQSLTGFAISTIDVDNPKNHFTQVYKSPYNGVERLSDIRQFLSDRVKSLTDDGCEIADIAMEGTVLASHSALVLGELSATVKLALYWLFADGEPHLRTPLLVPPMTLKKYATGKGTSKKQEMLMQIYKRWGVEFNDDNAADAYALARLAGKLHIDAVEKQVVDQVQDPKYRDTIQSDL